MMDWEQKKAKAKKLASSQMKGMAIKEYQQVDTLRKSLSIAGEMTKPSDVSAVALAVKLESHLKRRAKHMPEHELVLLDSVLEFLKSLPAEQAEMMKKMSDGYESIINYYENHAKIRGYALSSLARMSVNEIPHGHKK